MKMIPKYEHCGVFYNYCIMCSLIVLGKLWVNLLHHSTVKGMCVRCCNAMTFLQINSFHAAIFKWAIDLKYCLCYCCPEDHLHFLATVVPTRYRRFGSGSPLRSPCCASKLTLPIWCALPYTLPHLPLGQQRITASMKNCKLSSTVTGAQCRNCACKLGWLILSESTLR